LNLKFFLVRQIKQAASHPKWLAPVARSLARSLLIPDLPVRCRQPPDSLVHLLVSGPEPQETDPVWLPYVSSVQRK
jgi:hypothetical protein